MQLEVIFGLTEASQS